MARPPRTRVDLAAVAGAFSDFDEQREDVRQTLLQMAMADPPPGEARLCQVIAGADLEPIKPGKWRDVGFVNRLTRLPPDCPVIPLGMNGMTAFFLNTMGRVVDLDAKSSGKGPIEYIFAGRTDYLEWAWPRWSRGRNAQVVGYEADDARQALVNACAYIGFFQLDDQVRGRGAWCGADGRLIYHAGDRVWINGKWRDCGRHGDLIYPTLMPIGRWSPAPQPAGSDGPGEMLLDLLRSFNWDRGELDARLMLGWTMTAKIGGALDRRPVGFVTGTEGAGKSTLQTILRLVMHKALIKTSNTTQAGIYQKLGQDSIAILVDEMGDKEDSRTASKILELARICYSGDVMQRGGQDGVGKEFSLNSSFLGSSIAKPATKSQDDSRMFVGMLRERVETGAQLTVDEAVLEGVGDGLLRRWFDWWPRWPQLQSVFRHALIAAGHDDRACDTFVPLAAAAHLALSDDLPTEAELEQWGVWLKADQLEETAGRQKTWQRCLWYLLDAQPEVFRNKTEKSVRAVLNRFERGAYKEMDVEDYLPHVGLALSWPDDEPLHTLANGRLFVPTTMPALNDLFAGTAWAGSYADPGPWNGVLRQMPRELFISNAVSGKGLDKKCKGVFIHLAKALEA